MANDIHNEKEEKADPESEGTDVVSDPLKKEPEVEAEPPKKEPEPEKPEPEKPEPEVAPAAVVSNPVKKDEPLNFLGITNREVVMMGIVFIAGGLGALVADIMGKSIMVWQHNGMKAMPLGWLKMFSVGGIAAGLGVYLVAASDVRLVGRTIFFAVACGLSAQIVISKAMSSLEESMGIDAKGRVMVADVDSVNDVQSGGGDKSVTLLIASAQDAAMLYIERARMAVGNSDFALSAEHQRKAIRQISDIVSAGQEDPAQVLEAIGRIADWAKIAGAEEVVTAVEERLSGIKRASESSAKPELVSAVEAITDDLNLKGTEAADAQPKLGGRVYLEVGDTYLGYFPVDWKKIAGVSGYTFILPKKASDTDYKECRVIYYRPEDKDGAEELLKQVKANIAKDYELGRQGTFLVQGIRGARPRHYDLRLGRGVIEQIELKLKPSEPAPSAPPAKKPGKPN